MSFALLSDGTRAPRTSEQCQYCGHIYIDSKTDATPDFTGSGWHYATSFSCKNKKCQAVWNEKTVVLPGGRIL